MHGCDFTTAYISSKYVYKQHIDHGENEIEFNQFENRDVSCRGTMLKAPVAPVPLMVSCSKLRTTFGAERCTQCSPSNVYRKVDDPR